MATSSGGSDSGDITIKTADSKQWGDASAYRLLKPFWHGVVLMTVSVGDGISGGGGRAEDGRI
jgi:hypothetical protein